jgi:hypothetical protein
MDLTQELADRLGTAVAEQDVLFTLFWINEARKEGLLEAVIERRRESSPPSRLPGELADREVPHSHRYSEPYRLGKEVYTARIHREIIFQPTTQSSPPDPPLVGCRYS